MGAFHISLSARKKKVYFLKCQTNAFTCHFFNGCTILSLTLKVLYIFFVKRTCKCLHSSPLALIHPQLHNKHLQTVDPSCRASCVVIEETWEQCFGEKVSELSSSPSFVPSQAVHQLRESTGSCSKQSAFPSHCQWWNKGFHWGLSFPSIARPLHAALYLKTVYGVYMCVTECVLKCVFL